MNNKVVQDDIDLLQENIIQKEIDQHYYVYKQRYSDIYYKSNKLKRHLESNIKLSNKTIKNFIKLLEFKLSHKYFAASDKYLSCLPHIFTYYDPDMEDIKILLNYNASKYESSSILEYIKLSIETIIKRNINIIDNINTPPKTTEEIMIYIFENALEYNDQLAQIMLPRKATESYMLKAVEKNRFSVVEHFLMQKMPVKKIYMDIALRNNNDTMLELLFDNGLNYKFTSKELDEQCRQVKNPYIIEFMLRYSDIKITDNHFNALVANIINISSFDEMMKILFKHGYRLTEEQIIKLLDDNIYNSSIEHYHKITKEIWINQNSYQDWYYTYTEEIDIDILHAACKFHNLQDIKKIIKSCIKNDVKPDQICLENICANNSISIVAIKFLVETHNIKPNIKCLKNALKKNRSRTIMEYLINNIPNE